MVVGVEVVTVVGVGGDVVPVSFRHVGEVDVSAVTDGRRRCHRRDKNLKNRCKLNRINLESSLYPNCDALMLNIFSTGRQNELFHSGH